jgi:hypothetical protein
MPFGTIRFTAPAANCTNVVGRSASRSLLTARSANAALM